MLCWSKHSVKFKEELAEKGYKISGLDFSLSPHYLQTGYFAIVIGEVPYEIACTGSSEFGGHDSAAWPLDVK